MLMCAPYFDADGKEKPLRQCRKGVFLNLISIAPCVPHAGYGAYFGCFLRVWATCLGKMPALHFSEFKIYRDDELLPNGAAPLLAGFPLRRFFQYPYGFLVAAKANAAHYFKQGE